MDESCSHCGGITVAVLRTRLRFLQGGGVPVPLPRSRVPPGGRQGSATSGSSRAGLTVRNSKKIEGSSCHRHFATCGAAEGIGRPLSGGYRLYPLVLPPTIGCRSLHQTILEMMIQYRCHPLGGQQCRIRIRKWWLCLPGPLKGLGSSGGLHRVPNPRGWTIGFLGGPRWFSGPHPGALLPGSA